ncbi:MAG: hypothetical protein CMI09_03860 [Oceanospirillaceae bacterium]|nr:hypothetical protein [Oceanospirillaceae bacterium]
MNASTDIELDPAVKSRPDYPPVAIDARASHQVFIAEDNEQTSLTALSEQCQTGEKLSIVADAESLPVSLAELPLSTALYVSGSEGYLWDIHNRLTEMGFGVDKIHLLAPASAARRLFCTHCYTTMEGVAHTPYTCTGCGRPLLVRDHFSRILGAYVGVQINAEDPADLPATESLDESASDVKEAC